MARQRKTQKQPTKSSAPEDTIPEEEQWRLIDQTGVLKNVHRADGTEELQTIDSDNDPFSPLCLEIFNTFLLIIPFSSLYIMMDM